MKNAGDGWSEQDELLLLVTLRELDASGKAKSVFSLLHKLGSLQSLSLKRAGDREWPEKSCSAFVRYQEKLGEQSQKEEEARLRSLLAAAEAKGFVTLDDSAYFLTDEGRAWVGKTYRKFKDSITAEDDEDLDF